MELNFDGKSRIYAHHETVPISPLVPDKAKSLNPVDDDNLIIHGDSLPVLKALLPRYAGRVKCIYIDPPYNTGNGDWIYNDRVDSPLMQRWLEEAKEVDDEDLERHDKWMCMMWPRLQLLKKLLTDDGLIFISIDDNEHHRLRIMMDEIFNEASFRGSIIVKRGVSNIQSQFTSIKKIKVAYESILIYSKTSPFKIPTPKIKLLQEKKGEWDNLWRNRVRDTLVFELFGITPETGCWTLGKDRCLTGIKNYKKLVKELNAKNKPLDDTNIEKWWKANKKEGIELDLVRLSKEQQPKHYVPPHATIPMTNNWLDLNSNGSKKLSKIIVEKFDNPKNVDLIKRIINISTNENDIVLDSFAGSGTTAHAVLALNKEDGGNRKFILAECEEYADRITAERIRRVINGIPDSACKELQGGLGGSFTYCTLGEPLDVNKILMGEKLPDYHTLASHLLYTSTGASTSKKLNSKNKDGLFYSADGKDFYLLYKADLKYLRSDKAVLNAERAKRVSNASKKAVFFGVGTHMELRDLARMHIEFCQIPDEIRRV